MVYINIYNINLDINIVRFFDKLGFADLLFLNATIAWILSIAPLYSSLNPYCETFIRESKTLLG